MEYGCTRSTPYYIVIVIIIIHSAYAISLAVDFYGGGGRGYHRETLSGRQCHRIHLIALYRCNPEPRVNTNKERVQSTSKVYGLENVK